MFKTHNEMFDAMVSKGGVIVSSDVCTEIEIKEAQEKGNWFVDEHAFGFVLRSQDWLDQIYENENFKSKLTKYLDECIEHWRRAKDVVTDQKELSLAVTSVDIFQSVRISMLGKLKE